jgi:hypothetical protein
MGNKQTHYDSNLVYKYLIALQAATPLPNVAVLISGQSMYLGKK